MNELTLSRSVTPSYAQAWSPRASGTPSRYSPGPTKTEIASGAQALHVGHSGPDVAEAQRKLGGYEGKIDGLFGPKTAAAVVAFQRERGLPVTGQIDKATLAALDRAEPAELPPLAMNLPQPAKGSPLEQTLRGWSLSDIPSKLSPSDDLDAIFRSSLTNIGRAVNADGRSEGAARFNGILRDLAAMKAEGGGSLRGQLAKLEQAGLPTQDCQRAQWSLLERLRELGRDYVRPDATAENMSVWQLGNPIRI